MTASVSAAPQVQTVPMTRREFLYYIWGASMALLTAESVGAIIWFSIPRFREGEFGGVFRIAVDKLPAVDSGPEAYPEGRFWLVNLGDQTVNDPRQPKDASGNVVYPVKTGVQAIYTVCVHLGCLYKWVPTNNRFECPCHGSKFLLNGVRVDGPARRNLDVLVTQIVDAAGNVLAETKAGDTNSDDTVALPLDLPANAAEILINTGKRVEGAFNDKPGGGR